VFKRFTHPYDDIISIENLLKAWNEFKKGKTKKKDVQEFEYRLFDNILDLHNELKAKTYTHGPYHAFTVNDPKQRDEIYTKLASVTDYYITQSIECRIHILIRNSFTTHILVVKTKEHIGQYFVLNKCLEKYQRITQNSALF